MTNQTLHPEDKLRIVMLSYHTCPLATLGGKDTGGMNVYVKEIAEKLGALGHHVDVFTRSQDVHVPHVIHDLGYGNRVIHIPAGPETPIPKDRLGDYINEFVKNVNAFSIKKSISYSLIHSHYWLSGLAGVQLKKEWNVPLVHMFHTLGLMKNRIAEENQIEDENRVKGERKVLKEADRLVAATTAELAQLQWLYETNVNKISTISPGVNLKRFYPIAKDEAKEYIHIAQDKKMILFVGRIEPLKGIDSILSAFSILKQKNTFRKHDVCLYIIGGNADEDDLKLSEEMKKLIALVRTSELQDNVFFLGKRSQKDLPYYYSAAEVLVMPSHYESFGMVALEAMACGTPVIASQVGGLAYLVVDGKNGFHVQNNSVEELSNKIEFSLENEAIINRMSVAAQQYAVNFDWDLITQKMVVLYKNEIAQFNKS